LILVLWIFAALTLFMFTTLRASQVDHRISAGSADRFRALEVARSGIESVLADLLEDDSPADGPWDLWYDDPGRYEGASLPGDGGGTMGGAGDDLPYGRFTVFAGDPSSPDLPLRYGAEDESGKINLNTATRDMLLALSPRMTEEIADAILDWRDGDSKPGPAGAEDSYYLTLAPPYRCKNAPFESVEELLLVRGVDAMLLYGEDWNRNGMLDPAENDGEANDPPDDGDGELDRGLWHLCTVWSYDRNLTNDGRARVNINTASDAQLRSALGSVLTGDQIKAIVSGRSKGGYPSTAALLDLAGWDARAFQAAADLVTVTDGKTLPGLVNVNTAPREVLLALPGMTEDLADAAVAFRSRSQAPLANIGWLLNVMDKAALQRIASRVTVRSAQFAIQSVGWIPNARGVPPVYARVWAVYDMADGGPLLRAWKDLTPLGFPYPLGEEAQ
jgi:type II secretory pathway component PulK